MKREPDELYEMLDKLSFWKAVRVMAWIARFIRNCQETENYRPIDNSRDKQTAELLDKEGSER